jgi:hypothetical protein
MGEMSLRLSSVEGAAAQFAALPYVAPQALPYGMPGYGGVPALPASGPIISEIMHIAGNNIAGAEQSAILFL